MFKKLLIMSLIIGSVGCQSVDNVFKGPEQIEQLSDTTAVSIADLQSLPIENGAGAEITIQEQTQRLNGYGIDSPVAVFALPPNYKTYQVFLRSYYGYQIFAPSAIVIDEKGNKIADIPNTDFVYKSGSFHLTYREEAKLTITPEKPADQLFIVVYTTKDDASKSSKIMVRNSETTEEEVTIPHEYTGKVAIELKASEATKTIVAVNEKENTSFIKVDDGSSKTEKLFNDLRTTIEKGHTQKALDLVDQIQALQLEANQ